MAGPPQSLAELHERVNSAFGDLREALRDMQFEADVNLDEIDKLKRKIEDFDRTLGRLIEEQKSGEPSFAMLSDRMHNIEEAIRDLQKEKPLLRGLLEDMRDIELELGKLKGTFLTLKDFERQESKITEKIKSLEHRFKEAEKSASKLSKFRERDRSANIRFLNITNEIARLKKSLKKIDSEKVSGRIFEKQEGEIKKLAKEQENLEKEFQALSHKLKILERFQAEIELLREKSLNRADFEKHESSILQVVKEQNSKIDKLAKMATSSASLSEIEKIKRELRELAKSFVTERDFDKGKSKLKEAIKEFDNKLFILNKRYENAIGDLQASFSELNAVKTQTDQINSKLSDFYGELERLKKESVNYADFEKQERNVRGLIDSLSSKLDKHAKNEPFGKKFAQFSHELARLKKKMSELENEKVGYRDFDKQESKLINMVREQDRRIKEFSSGNLLAKAKTLDNLRADLERLKKVEERLKAEFKGLLGARAKDVAGQVSMLQDKIKKLRKESVSYRDFEKHEKQMLNLLKTQEMKRRGLLLSNEMKLKRIASDIVSLANRLNRIEAKIKDSARLELKLDKVSKESISYVELEKMEAKLRALSKNIIDGHTIYNRIKALENRFVGRNDFYKLQKQQIDESANLRAEINRLKQLVTEGLRLKELLKKEV